MKLFKDVDKSTSLCLKYYCMQLKGNIYRLYSRGNANILDF